MSLFSKLFSRDDKAPEGAQGESAQTATAPSAKPAAGKPDAAAVGGDAARNKGGKGAASDKTEHTSVATPGDKAGQNAQPQPSAANQRSDSNPKDARAAQPPAAAAKAPPIKPGASGKREKPPNNKTLLGQGALVNAPPAPAGAPKANPPASAAAAAKPAAPSAAHLEPQVTHKIAPAAPVPSEPGDSRAAVAKPVAPKPEPAPAVVVAVPVPVPVQVVQPSAAQAQAHAPEPKSHANLEAALDSAMEALMAVGDPKAPQAAASTDLSDERALAETFAAVARVHAQPLREFMFQLDLGRTPRDWTLASRPVLKPLLEAAQQIGMLELVGALGGFDAALERAGAEPATTISDRATQSLKQAYQGLCLHMPDVFTPEANSDGRRTVYLESLLLQIPELHRRTLTKLYAAGLSSLTQLSQARPDELSAVAGIEEGLAKRMVEHVHRFEQQRTSLPPTERKSNAHERLRGIVSRLVQLQADFEQAESEESVDKKRDVRRQRESALLELDLVFAEIGEVSVIEELKRCPVQLKIRRVATYLEAAELSA